MVRLPLAWPTAMLMAVALPAPTTYLPVRLASPHASVTVWALAKVTPLVIVAVAVIDAPPSVSTGSPFWSVSAAATVKLHAAVTCA